MRLEPRSEHDYWRHVGDAFLAESEAAADLLRGLHRPTEGGFREALLRRFLRQQLPDRFAVSTGFVRWWDQPSRQLDVLVWDRMSHAPLLEEGELAIVEPEAAVAVAEVKTTLSHKELASALDLLYHPRWENRPSLPVRSPVRCIIAMHSGWQQPDGLIRTLLRFYRDQYTRAGHYLCLQVRPPALDGADPHRLGDFLWPRFPELLDLICVVEPGWTVSQAAVYNPDPDRPGYDPVLLVSETPSGNSGGLALGQAIAILAELVVRSDPRSSARHRRSRLTGIGGRRLGGRLTGWLPGGDAYPPQGGDVRLRFADPPLWRRPFPPLPDEAEHWPLTYGR